MDDDAPQAARATEMERSNAKINAGVLIRYHLLGMGSCGRIALSFIGVKLRGQGDSNPWSPP